MPNNQTKHRWATIAQLRALPKIPTRMSEFTPEEVTEAIHRMEHKEKINGAKRRYQCGT